MSRIKKYLQNIVIICISTVVALAVAELALRLVSPDTTATDPYLGTVMRPGGEYDANGFRNSHTLARADIVAIGDSQTQGNNATREEAWPMVLGALASTSVYSMAVGGFGPVQYAYLAGRAKDFHPKIAIVGFYLGNDLLDAVNTTYNLDTWKELRDPTFAESKETSKSANDATVNFRIILGSGVRPDSLQYKIFKVRLWIRAHSRAYSLLGDASRGLREKIGIASTKEEKQENIKDIAKEYPEIAYVYNTTPELSTILSPSYRLDTVDLSQAKTKEGWRIAINRLLEMKKIFADSHIEFVILIIPTKEKIYIEHMKAQKEVVSEELATYDKKESELLGAIEKFCSDHNIRCTSVLPSMTEAMMNGISVYGVTMDGHPVARGYQVIAKHVYQYLKGQQLLP